MSVHVIGSLNLDVVCRVADLPRPGETVAGLSIDRLPGGKGLNQAVAAARYGAATSMIGAVGDDDAGRALVAHLRGEGVDVSAVAEIAGGATGQAFINVSAAGENTIVVAGGANLLVNEAIDPPPDEGVFLAQLETPFAAIRALFESPAARRGLTILNAAPALADGRALFALSDVIVVNETELAAYAGLNETPASAEAAVAAARSLIAAPGQIVVVTLGEAGVVALSAGAVHRIQGRAVQAVDAVGAGDCFCGVLAACLDEGVTLPRALETANAAAALSTQRPGASPAMPTRAEVAAALG